MSTVRIGYLDLFILLFFPGRLDCHQIGCRDYFKTKSYKMKKAKLIKKLNELMILADMQGNAILDMIKKDNPDFDELDCMIDIAGKMSVESEPIIHEGPGGHFSFGCNQTAPIRPTTTTTAYVKVNPEAVKCETKEQYDFCDLMSKLRGDGSFASFKFISFSDYITRESLTEKWHDFLIDEAVKMGFKEGVKYESVAFIKSAETATTNPEMYNYGSNDTMLKCGYHNGLIYKNGKWATIIEETKKQPKPETFTKSDMLNFAKYANPEYCAGQWIGLDKVLDYFIKNKGK
jgi:hypothetical protein